MKTVVIPVAALLLLIAGATSEATAQENAACLSNPPDVLVPNFDSTTGYSSPTITTYGNSECPEFVVELDGVHGGRRVQAVASVSPATPISQATCANTTATMDIWFSTNNGGTWIKRFTWSGTGTWNTTAGCTFPPWATHGDVTGNVRAPNLANFRVGGSMRTPMTVTGESVETAIPIVVSFTTTGSSP